MSETVQGSQNQPLVAVVTPIYNGAKYIFKAMQSVQDQTYANIVHVVLNNASTDETEKAISTFLNGAKAVLYLKNEATLSLQDNWNKAFSYVPEKAVYAKLLCADDLMHPHAIERFVGLAEADSEVQLVLSSDVFADEIRRANLPRREAIYDGKFILQQLLTGKIGWLAYHHFFVRMLPELRGEQFCGLDWSQDPYVVARSLTYGKFGYIPEPLLYNRLHPESITGKQISEGGIKSHVVLLRLLSQFSEFAFDEAGRKRALDRYRQRMARLDLLFRMTGRRSGAAALRRALSEHDLRLSLWDYLESCAVWPFYYLEKRKMTAPIGPKMDEPSFLRYALR